MTKTGKFVPGLLLLALTMAPPVMAQGEVAEDSVESLKQEIQQLKAGQAAMRRQLAEIKNLVQQGAAPKRPKNVVPDVTIDLKGFPFKGEVNAPITVVEFSDFK